MLHPPVRTSFATADPDEGRARVAADYADNRMRVRGDHENFRYRQTRTDLGVARFDTFENSLVTDYVLDPLRQVIVARMLEGEMDIRTEQIDRRFGPGDIALIAQPDKTYASQLRSASMQLVCLDLSLLGEVDDSDGSAPRLRYAPLRPAEARAWQRTVDYVTATVADDDAAASPLVLGAATRLLAATALSTFVEATPSETAQERLDAAPVVVRRATAFCDANPDLDIGVEDIARACHVSVRAVQLAFRRHLDTTPMAYLRKVRLDRARAELVAADPAVATVTRIALRWGFADASRFSALYRAAYGEVPSETLRQG